jgi:cell division protease FtsH
MSNGASNDLERATALARRMVTVYGMSERLGAIALDSADESRTYSEHTAQQIDAEVRRLVDEAYTCARGVIVERRAVLDRLADALLRWETLQGADLERVFRGDTAGSEPMQVSHKRTARRGAMSASPRLLPGAAMSLEPCRDA